MNLRAEYQYDIMDRITSIDWKKAGGMTVMSFDYQYSAAGMITNRILNGKTTAYEYDDLDRLISVDDASSFVQYSYDAAGNRQTKTGSDFAVSYSLGNGNRLASWSAASTNDFESFRILEVHGSSSEAIGTDNRWGQLYVSNSVAVTPEIAGTNFWVNSFVTGLGTQQIVAAIRDQAGNVGYATNEIFRTVVTNGAYAYNAAGCLTNISYSGTQYADSKALTWNSQYQLVSVDDASSFVSYTYDVLGRRSSRAVAGGGDPGSTNIEHYVYDGNQVVADLDESGNLIRSYTWGPGIDNLLAMTVYGLETNTYFAIKGVQNTVHALVDESGSIVESYEYDAWGRTTVFDSAGNALAESAIGNRYCFQGREIDWTTGLYYFRARWYDPVVGRWLSKDPIGISGGLNQYVFCGNNPINRTDPFGLCEEGYWDRFNNQYDQELAKHGDVLKWADTLGLWGLGAMGANAAAGAAQGLADFAAGEQIANSALAGVNNGGSMWARQAAAAEGAGTAARTAAGKAALGTVGKVTGVVTVGATSYSVNARIIAAGRALIGAGSGN